MVTTSGRWMRPVGQELGLCESGLAGWGWNYSGEEERVLVRVDVTGTKRSWRLPAAIRQVRYTRDCSNVWIITEGWKHLYALNANADAEPVGLEQPLAREIDTLYVSEDGQRAWIKYDDTPQLMLVTRTAHDLTVAPIAGDEAIEIDNVKKADRGNALWVEPTSPGLFLANAHGYREIEGFTRPSTSPRYRRF